MVPTSLFPTSSWLMTWWINSIWMKCSSWSVELVVLVSPGLPVPSSSHKACRSKYILIQTQWLYPQALKSDQWRRTYLWISCWGALEISLAETTQPSLRSALPRRSGEFREYWDWDQEKRCRVASDKGSCLGSLRYYQEWQSLSLQEQLPERQILWIPLNCPLISRYSHSTQWWTHRYHCLLQ